MGFDVVLWVFLAVAAYEVDSTAVTVLVAVVIGAWPLHDLLVHGHEATHRIVSRRPWVNESALWLSHALVGMSGSAYRAFHLRHHRRTHTSDDPEVRFLQRFTGRPIGWSYLLVGVTGSVYVNLWALRRRSRTRRVVAELCMAVLFHLTIAAVVGPGSWCRFVLLPTVTGLSAVVALRSACEHHHAVAGSRWTNTRAMYTNRGLQWAWSNVNHHLEHHLYPNVPCHALPRVRVALAHDAPVVGVSDRGYLRTGLRLLRESNHFATRTEEGER